MPDLTVTLSGSGETTMAAGNRMVSEVARIVGDETDTNVRSQALGCINRVRMALNRREWRFKKVTASPITLVAGTKTYTLPSAFNRPSFARLLDTSSRPDGELRYMDDAWLAHQNPDQESTGKPVFYLLRNHFSDGLVTLYPTPDSSAATNWTLSVEYYGRIAEIADDATPISEPEELYECLVAGAQYCMLKERNHADRMPMARDDYYQALGGLIAWDRRVSDERARFSITPGYVPFGTVYIRA